MSVRAFFNFHLKEVYCEVFSVTFDRCTHKRSSVFNRIGMPKLLGLVKFRLTNFLKDYLFYFNFFKIVLFRKKKIYEHTRVLCLGSALATALFTFSSLFLFLFFARFTI